MKTNYLDEATVFNPQKRDIALYVAITILFFDKKAEDFVNDKKVSRQVYCKFIV
jgi:hypothetical protein